MTVLVDDADVQLLLREEDKNSVNCIMKIEWTQGCKCEGTIQPGHWLANCAFLNKKEIFYS
jgi:hypothetical protein